MSSDNRYIRNGFGVARPYLYGDLSLPDFLKHVFGAEELGRTSTGSGHHVELRIGDSVVVVEAGEFPETARRGAVYVYVPDVDAAYRRALDAGATSIAEPADMPYGDRNAGVQDAYGNTWWIATLTAS